LSQPHIIVKVTQKRDLTLLLTVQSQPTGDNDLKSWYAQLHQAATFWAKAVNDPEYAKEPEILVNPAFVAPRFIACDNQHLDRVFVVHSGEPFFAAELVQGQALVRVGDESAVNSGAWTDMCRLVRGRQDFQ
jgi:hypothetical protein